MDIGGRHRSSTRLDYSMSDLNHPIPTVMLSAKLEALLFVAPAPVTLSQLSTALGISESELEIALVELEAYYRDRHLRIQRQAGRLQLTTDPQIASIIEKFLGLSNNSHLSRAALETLAIVAYQQPVTRPQVDSIRGVNSDGVMKSLLNKALIQEVGRSDGPGRPILYSTTVEFLQHFGLNSIDDLPPISNEIQVESP
jgi:segregation and condensation protein B